MIMLLFFSAYCINHARNEEAEGYLDNFIVGPVSRVKWLLGKLTYAGLAILIIAVLAAIATWIGAANVHSSTITIHSMLLAGLNSVPAALLLLGIGVFVFGFLPRLTSAAVYAGIGWSFLIDMLNDTKISHWILDTSILTHVHLAPAANINWGTNFIMLGLAIILSLLGIYRFNQRDIAAE